jgi:hypothetical protein
VAGKARAAKLVSKHNAQVDRARGKTGSRVRLGPLLGPAERGDRPEYKVYVVYWPRDSDPTIEGGFITRAKAEACRDRLQKERAGLPHGLGLQIWTRAELRRKQIDPAQPTDPRFVDLSGPWRYWRLGSERRLPSGSGPIEAVKVALHNVYWRIWGRPLRDLDEAVRDPQKSLAARERAADLDGEGDPKVAVFTEYAIPTDESFWKEVDAELRRLGAHPLTRRSDHVIQIFFKDERMRG